MRKTFKASKIIKLDIRERLWNIWDIVDSDMGDKNETGHRKHSSPSFTAIFALTLSLLAIAYLSKVM